MQVSAINPQAKVYNISAGKLIPDWIAARQKKSLRYDPEWRSRIELIQDLQFPAAATSIKFTEDGTHLVSVGVYKPMVRVYDLSQLSMKFERHMDCEVVEFEILSEDWTKMAFLQMDRTIEFHSQAGVYYKTRIPKFGRDMAYHTHSCDMYVAGATNEVYRLNLDQGRFLAPFVTGASGNNVCRINPKHFLLGLGSENGIVEFWDPRVRTRVGQLNCAATMMLPENSSMLQDSSLPEVTALTFHPDGLNFCVGLSSGQVLMYDLRRTSPLMIKDHQYGFPIKGISYHTGSGNIVSADTRIIKIWHEETGKALTSIEPTANINKICTAGDSGLVFAACETSRVQTYFLPSLGPAPKWVSFLDNLTEELEENPHTSVYDDYKFMTRSELESLGLSHLVGTNLLRPYMHGFFIDNRLYQKAKSIVNPFAYEEYRKRSVAAKIEEERKSRISAPKKLPRVNKQLAKRLLSEPAAKRAAASGAEQDPDNPLGDTRFARMFADPNFEVDVDSAEYQMMHPPKNKTKSVEEKFEKVHDSAYDDDEIEGKGSDESDSDDDLRTQVSKRKPISLTAARAAQYEDSDDDEEDQDTGGVRKPSKVDFFEIKPGQAIKGAATSHTIKDTNKKQSFEDRLKFTQNKTSSDSRKPSGNLQMTFATHKAEKSSKPTKHVRTDRRGVRDLKLKRLGGPQNFRPRK